MIREPRKITLDEPMAIDPSALYRAFFPFMPAEMAPFEKMGTCAVVDISGPLMQRCGFFWDGYDGIVSRVAAALADPSTSSLMLRIDSPGGSVAGLFEAASKIRELKKKHKKPMWAYADEAAFSAAYMLASTADKVIIPPTGGVGSIGVIAEAADRSKMLADAGIRVALVYSGKRKADLHPDAPLTDEAITLLQKRVNDLGEMFVDAVAVERNLPRQDVAGMEAGIFYGQDAVKAGLADAVMSMGSAITDLSTISPPKQSAHTKASDPMATTVPYGNEPVEDDRPWDGEAAVRELRAWASSDGSGDAEKMDWAKYRKGFAWYDQENSESFGAYKLPHHRVVDGSLKTSKSGVQAAAGALQGARGGVDIPESEMGAVRSHLGRHYEKWGGTPPWESAEKSAPTVTAQAKENTSMKLLLIELGLSEAASEAEAVRVLRARVGHVEKLLALTGQPDPGAALGVAEGWKTEAARVPDLKKQLDDINEQRTVADVDAMLSAASGKVTPAEMPALRAKGLEDPAWLKGYLAVKSSVLPSGRPLVEPPPSLAGKGPQKSWKEMTPREKGRLYQEDRPAYEALKAAAGAQ